MSKGKAQSGSGFFAKLFGRNSQEQHESKSCPGNQSLFAKQGTHNLSPFRSEPSVTQPQNAALKSGVSTHLVISSNNHKREDSESDFSDDSSLSFIDPKAACKQFNGLCEQTNNFTQQLSPKATQVAPLSQLPLVGQGGYYQGTNPNPDDDYYE